MEPEILTTEVNHGTWRYSGSLVKLAPSMAKAQAKVRSALKENVNPAFRSRYADLTSIWDACRDALSAEGLSVIQMPSSDGVKATITTLLLHSSGEWIASELTLKAMKEDAQGIGSAITYARRYALSSMVGIVADEDDDGNAASNPPKMQAAAPKPTPPPAPKPQVAPPIAQPTTLREKIAHAKTALPPATFTRVLKGFGYEAAEDIKDKEQAQLVYDGLANALKSLAVAQ